MKSRNEFEIQLLNLKNRKKELLARRDKIELQDPINKEDVQKLFRDGESLDNTIHLFRKEVEDTMNAIDYPIYFRLWNAVIVDATQLLGGYGITFEKK